MICDEKGIIDGYVYRSADKYDVQKLINSGWKLLALEQPSVNSWKSIMVIKINQHGTLFVQQADWDPCASDGSYGYSHGKITNPVDRVWAAHSDQLHATITQDVVFWRPMDTLLDFALIS